MYQAFYFILLISWSVNLWFGWWCESRGTGSVGCLSTVIMKIQLGLSYHKSLFCFFNIYFFFPLMFWLLYIDF